MNAIPEGFEPVNSSSIPEGFETVESDTNTLQQAGIDTKDVLKYNASKLGAGVNAGLANINEFIGLDSDLFRDNQAYYQDSANNADTALNRTYGDGIAKTLVKEVGNPINYIGGGIKTLMGIVGADSANTIATTGDRSGVNLQDASNAASDTAIGGSIGGVMDKVLGANPKRLLLGDDVRSPQQINDIKALATKHGIELTPASATGSANLARIENTIQEGLAGGLGMRQAINAERSTADNAIINRLEKMGANGSNVIAGENLRASTKAVIEQEQQYFYETFKTLFAKYGDAPIFSIRGVKQEAQKLVNQAETIPLIKNSTAYRDSKAILESADDLSWSDWSKLRTHLGGLTQDATVTGKASTGAYKNMYSKLENDLLSSVQQTGDTATLNQYKKVLEDYKGYKGLFEGKSSGSQFIRSLVDDKVRPEAVGSMINNSSLKAKSALEAGGIDINSGLPMAKKVSATDVLKASSSKTEDGLWLPSFLKYSDRDGFKTVANSPNKDTKFIKDLAISDDVIPPRYAKQQVSTGDGLAIEELQDIAKAIVQKDKFKNSSKSAQYNMINAMKTMNPLQLGKFIIKEVGLSALYRNNTFKSWLEKGILSKAEYDILRKTNATTRNAGRNVSTNTLLGLDDKKPIEKLMQK